jgi:glycerol-3-phosphate dehydrogenase subunit B
VKRVLVIGAGAAGTGAALAAAARGAEVTVVDGGSGATTLSPGALDASPWDAAERAPVGARAREVCAALDAYTLGDTALVTTSGIVRPAAGADRALLNLAGLAAGVVAVPRSDHAGWDAHALARAWAASAWAKARGLSFVPVDAQITRMADERGIADADIAARHDDAERIGWLAERLREALARAAVDGVRAVALPQWLGVDRARAAELSRAAGLPCGEAMGLPGGPAGLRFERARDRAIASRAIAVVRTRALGARRADPGWEVPLEQGEPLAADAVVLAAGGLVGGGLGYTPSHALFGGPLPQHPRASFSLGLEAPARVGSWGSEPTLPGSIYGEPPEALAWPFALDAPMERAGVVTREDGSVPGEDGLFAAGEMRADLARTWLASLESGARAGHAAAG